jgi:zinc protease
MVTFRVALALVFALALYAAVARAEPDPAQAALENLRLSIQRVRLDNGLRVVLQPDRSAPVVAIVVTYDVGSRNEVPGGSGFAHLFEHMMFQGSKHLKKGEHLSLVAARGGTLDATTSSDRTNYVQLLPSHELALGLWLEADRLRWLDLTRQNFENQRKVVEEEYRTRVENTPYAAGALRLSELAFQGYFPYEHPTIGSMADLAAARFESVRDFHRSYYAPNNAVLTIVGDFDPDEAMALVRRYFDGARALGSRPPYTPPPLPAQSAERSAVVRDRVARTPALYYGWVIPPARTPPHYALELLAIALAGGESSRLHQRLVRERAVLRNVSARTFDHRGPDLFVIQAELTSNGDPKAVRREIDAELARLSRTGPTAAELERARNQLRASFIFSLEPQLRRGIELGEFELYWGDARLLTRELEAYLAVSSADVKRALAEVLVPARRNVVEVLPP